MLTIGETIHSDVSGKNYVITWASDKITQAEVGFAATESEGEVYFIKRLLSMKYPTDESLGSPAMKVARRKKCDEHFRKYSALYKSIYAGCGSDGACVPIEDFFREGAFYYTVPARAAMSERRNNKFHCPGDLYSTEYDYLYIGK